jgi:hypothetical protein
MCAFVIHIRATHLTQLICFDLITLFVSGDYENFEDFLYLIFCNCLLHPSSYMKLVTWAIFPRST